MATYFRVNTTDIHVQDTIAIVTPWDDDGIHYIIHGTVNSASNSHVTIDHVSKEKQQLGRDTFVTLITGDRTFRHNENFNIYFKKEVN